MMKDCIHGRKKSTKRRIRYFRYFNITSNTNNYFATMVAFKMVLSNKRYAEYQDQFETIFNELSNKLNSISISKIRGIMGIPSNWKKLKKL